MQTITYNLSITIASAMVPTVTSMPNGAVGQSYSVQLGATGGTPPYTWSATGLPPGLTCTTGGLISGTPTTAGSFSINITGKDSGT